MSEGFKFEMLRYTFGRYDKDTCNALRGIFGEEDFNSLLTDGENEFELELRIERKQS
jgi:hypothetical protein